jgi:exonuclease SbcC
MKKYGELSELTNARAENGRQAELQQKIQRQARQAQETLVSWIADRKAEQQSLSGADARKEKYTAQKNQLKAQSDRLQQLLDRLDELAAHQKQLKKKQDEYLAVQLQADRCRQDYDVKNRAFLREQAGILATTLTDGLPCPVCGAVTHPHPAALSPHAPTEADVQRAKERYELAQAKAAQASDAAGKQKGICDATEASVAKMLADLLPDADKQDARNEILQQQTVLKTQMQTLEQRIGEAEQAVERYRRLETAIPQQEVRLQKIVSEESRARENLVALTALHEQQEKRMTDLRAELRYPDQQAAETARRNLNVQLQRLQQAQTDAEQNVNNIREQLAGICAAAKQLQEQLADATEADVTALTAEKTALLTGKSKILDGQRTLHARIAANEYARKNIAQKSGELEELDARYAWIKALSDTANGTVTGKQKMMLETFIQTTFFDRILQRANLRLRKMSGGQYDLKRREDEESKRGQSGLELDIIDHINATERSVNTLSGGEAFLASLALALGLSDEVQMSTGIRLDTLFVDEGFGSLDSESLGKAYHALSGLTEGNRLVGIISHVAELKERIDKQIIVTKSRTGGSAARIRTE